MEDGVLESLYVESLCVESLSVESLVVESLLYMGMGNSIALVLSVGNGSAWCN